ncbi:MAG: tetratricopeptide repeat protein [Planctomycetaceae bacterium]
MSANAQRKRRRRLEAAGGYLALQMPDHALRELNGIDDTQDDAFEFHRLHGEALRQKERYDAALAAFERGHAIQPRSLDILMGMAWCLKRTDQLSEAIAVMDQAYAAAPNEPVVLYNLSCYYALAGDKGAALSWLGRALRMDGSLGRLIDGEHDFDSLRRDPHFRFIVAAGTKAHT